MNKDKNAAGAGKETASSVAAKLQGDGKAEKAVDRIQKAVGGVFERRDAARGEDGKRSTLADDAKDHCSPERPSMPDAGAASPILPSHIEDTIQAIAQLEAEHHASATPHQRLIDRITSMLGRPVFIVVLTAIVVAWVSLNSLAAALGYRPLDPPPFALLTGVASLGSLYLVVLIVTTQRRDDRLSERRELLNLELTTLIEQRTAKVVALLEELRRDSPAIHDRVDKLAEAMARPADPQSMIAAIEETRSEITQSLLAAEGASRAKGSDA